MNREQYLAKRMWMRGVSPGSDGIEVVSRFDGDDEASWLPTTSPFSLADYYQRLHAGHGKGKEGKPY